ncbi:tyrosine-type recombinase/integrase [Methylomonas sp. UP202]|uniref:tyrosine-type recombinase/integrase n=1 Tax=Methylomonas sp. UP202 TaxID=3040943 RepID=UPI00247A8229|nr:tyrosine-type recombinase/integrase [Methylomonas sp. UP202]WGS85005.1 tyrosine-type recombinase/integrase [Methylomonas sp. UP202]
MVQQAWDEYVAKKSPRWSHHHIIDHAKVSAPGGQPKKRGGGVTVQSVLYPLLQMRMIDIAAEVLEQWQTQEAETRATAARHGFVLFRSFWNWCAEQKAYQSIIDPQSITKEVRAVVPKAGTKKSDVLQRAHLKDWFESVRALSNQVIAAYLQGLLLTGARREELAELKWSDIDFKLGAMWLKDKVDDEGRMIPLPPYLASLVAALPRRNEWVFSSPTAADGKLAEPRIAHNRALDTAGLEHVTLHGLRRTFASLAEWVEMPVGVVAQIMGHKPNATAEKHYKTRPLELLAIWHGKYEAWILEQAGIEFEHSEQLQGLRAVK